MQRFSERYGYKPIRDHVQKESVEKQTRTQLWNFLKIVLWDEWESYAYGWATHSQHVNQLMRRMWVHHFNASLDNLPGFDPYETNGAYGIMKRYFMDAKWFEVYDFWSLSCKIGLAVMKTKLPPGSTRSLRKSFAHFVSSTSRLPQLPTN